MSKPASTTPSLLSDVLKYGTWIAFLAAAFYCLDRCTSYYDDASELPLEPTAAVIEDIKPIGELYVLTAITEDFEIDVMEDRGFFITSYPKCIQILRQQVSFVLNLDSVDYVPREGTDTVVVRLPQLTFVQSNKGGQFLCEAERSDYDAARLIGMVERTIKRKYATAQNYERAMANARQVLDAFVRQAGRVPVFEEKVTDPTPPFGHPSP